MWEIRTFIDEKTNSAREDDIILLTGSFNVNSSSIKEDHSPRRKNKDVNKSEIMDSEYFNMTRILSKNFEFDIEDCGKKSHGGSSPVTYGDYFEFDDGERIPMETSLTY